MTVLIQQINHVACPAEPKHRGVFVFKFWIAHSIIRCDSHAVQAFQIFSHSLESRISAVA